MNPSIVVTHLSQSVRDSSGALNILHDVSFTVEDGQAVAITGSSGSGKSTLLGLLAGLDAPSAGQVQLLGHDLFALDEDARAALRAQTVGFVFQSFQLLPHMSALENVMLPLELAGKSSRALSGSPDPRAAAVQMLERVGLQDRLHHYPRTLSGGEQQRVALARAFVVRPRVLFADEPTGSLDAGNGARVMDLMMRLHREQGSTLVLVTHDARLAALCQRVFTLEAGRLLSDGQRAATTDAASVSP